MTAPDRNERIDHLQPGLQRHGDRRAIHDLSSGTLDGETFGGSHRPLAIERTPQRIDDAAEQPLSHYHVHHTARALDFITRMEMRVITEQHDTDLVFIHVEGDAENAARKLQQLLISRSWKPRHGGDAGRYGRDRADLAQDEPRREGLACLTHAVKGAVEHAFQGFGRGAHALISSSTLSSREAR